MVAAGYYSEIFTGQIHEANATNSIISVSFVGCWQAIVKYDA
jgi:hypothetical protein